MKSYCIEFAESTLISSFSKDDPDAVPIAKPVTRPGGMVSKVGFCLFDDLSLY